MEITKEEFVQWKNSKVTEYVLDLLDEYHEEYLDALRGYIRVGETIQAVRCEGLMEGLEQILAIDYEDPQENEDA